MRTCFALLLATLSLTARADACAPMAYGELKKLHVQLQIYRYCQAAAFQRMYEQFTQLEEAGMGSFTSLSDVSAGYIKMVSSDRQMEVACRTERDRVKRLLDGKGARFACIPVASRRIKAVPKEL